MRWFVASHDFQAISLRYFNVAGATERNGEDHEPETHLMPIMLKVAAGEATHVQIFGQDYPTPDGTCIRDFIHVRDLAAAHLRALEVTGEGDPSFEVYNLGSAAGFSVREVVEAARKVTGRAIPARVVKRRTGDPPVLVASSRRARLALGWHPEHSKLEQMLADAWAWRLTHPHGYAKGPRTDGAADRPPTVRRPRGPADLPTRGLRLGLTPLAWYDRGLVTLPRSPRLPETTSPAPPRRARAPRRAAPPPSASTQRHSLVRRSRILSPDGRRPGGAAFPSLR